MQREILFKAKILEEISRRNFGRDYAIGNFYYKWSAFYRKYFPTIQHIYRPDFKPTNCCAFTEFEIYPDTICQYTGLKDADGNKIFENDILQAPDRTMVVVFCDETFTYYFKDLDYINKGTCLEYTYVFKEKTVEHFGLKIIGNVHDEKQ